MDRVTRQRLEERVEHLNKVFNLTGEVRFRINGRYNRTYLELENTRTHCPVGSFSYCGTKREVDTYTFLLSDAIGIYQEYNEPVALPLDGPAHYIP